MWERRSIVIRSHQLCCQGRGAMVRSWLLENCFQEWEEWPNVWRLWSSVSKIWSLVTKLLSVIPDDSDHTVTFCPLNETSHSPPNIPIGTYQIQLLSGVNPRWALMFVTKVVTKMIWWSIIISLPIELHYRIVLSTWSAVPTPSSTRDKAILTINGITTPTLEWLKTVLLPKVSQWTKESWLQPQAVKGKSLIPLSRYSQLYSELKRKYGESLVKVGNTIGWCITFYISPVKSILYN